MKDESEKSREEANPNSSFILPPSSLDFPSSFSHFPAIPPPVKVNLVTFGPHDCSYIPGRQSLNRAFWAESMPPRVYHAFLNAGFRRSGKIIYQPACVGCRKCISVRVPTATFVMSKSQRRVWRKNADLTVTSSVAADPDDERYALYRRYVTQWHGKQLGEDEEEQSYSAFVAFLYDSPAHTMEYQYRDPAGQLLAVGICDLSEESFSSVYYYYDPDHTRRSLGTFGALHEIAEARRMKIPYYYLGYWVDVCSAMAYKATFRPYELLHPDGIWRLGPDESQAGQNAADQR